MAKTYSVVTSHSICVHCFPTYVDAIQASFTVIPKSQGKSLYSFPVLFSLNSFITWTENTSENFIPMMILSLLNGYYFWTWKYLINLPLSPALSFWDVPSLSLSLGFTKFLFVCSLKTLGLVCYPLVPCCSQAARIPLIAFYVKSNPHCCTGTSKGLSSS